MEDGWDYGALHWSCMESGTPEACKWFLLSSHGQGRKPCPLCEVVDLDAPVFDHVLERHMNRLSIGGSNTLNKLIAPVTFSFCTLLQMCMFSDVCILYYVCNHAPCWANIDEPLKMASFTMDNNHWVLWMALYWPGWTWSSMWRHWVVVELHALISISFVLKW